MASEPSTWSVLHDDAKSHITLATALLGLSATFSDRLLSDDSLGRRFVFGGWIVLGISIFASIWANGQIFKGLKTSSTNHRPALVWLNISVWLLLAGAIGLTVGAWRTSIGDGDGPSHSSLAKEVVAQMTNGAEEDLVVESIEEMAGDDVVLLVRNGVSGELFEVTIDNDRDEVTAAHSTS